MIIPSFRTTAPVRLVQRVGCILCIVGLVSTAVAQEEDWCWVSSDSGNIGHCGIVDAPMWTYYTARFAIPPPAAAGGKCVYHWEVYRKFDDSNGELTITSPPWVLDVSNRTSLLANNDDRYTLADPNCTDSCEVIVRSAAYFNTTEPTSSTIQHRFHSYYVRDDGKEEEHEDSWSFPTLTDEQRDNLPSWTLTVTEDSCTYTSSGRDMRAGGGVVLLAAAVVIGLMVVAVPTT
jgi:hypothetical protein